MNINCHSHEILILHLLFIYRNSTFNTSTISSTRCHVNSKWNILEWTAVTGIDPSYNILYVVRYSTDRGNETDPPSDAIKRSGITATSTKLTGLQSDITTYYVWVAAEILGAGVQGPYSTRVLYGGEVIML